MALLGTFLVASCGDSDGPSVGEWAGSVDTLASGRVVVQNPDVPTDDGVWSLQERFRLGSLDAEGPELFGSIDGLALGPDGGVYVLDGQSSEVRIFDREGRFQRAFGGKGEGPGELSGPGGLAVDSQETAWVLNWGNGRYTGYDPATGVVRREVPRLVSFASFPWPGAFEHGARLLDVGLDARGQPAILRLDTTFVPKDTLPLPAPDPDDRIVFRRGSMVIASLMEPFAPQPTWAPRPNGGIILAEGAVYRFHRIGFDGDTAMTVSLDRDPVAVTAAERDTAMAVFEEMTASLEGAVPDRRPHARPTKPAHGPVFVDDQDRTWVLAMGAAGTAPRWDVFDAEGRFFAQIAVPDQPGFIRPAVRGGRMAVVSKAAGFPSVIVYELIRVPEH